MFPLEQKLADWMQSELIDPFEMFHPEHLGNPFCFFDIYTRTSLLCHLIDGREAHQHSWSSDPEEWPQRLYFGISDDF